VWIRGSFPPL